MPKGNEKSERSGGEGDKGEQRHGEVEMGKNRDVKYGGNGRGRGELRRAWISM
jgi:hypothetical protein